MTFADVGDKVLESLGNAECIARYKTNDPEYVGALALRAGHVSHEGVMVGTTKYVVKRGTDPAKGISLRTTNKDYAEGFAAGLNHTGKKYWYRVEEIKENQE